MIQWVKTKVRWLVLQALWITDSWVIPSTIYEHIDAKCFGPADNFIERQAKLYPYDPEITKARTLLSFEAKCHAEDVD